MITGSKGRMGQALQSVAREIPGLEVVGLVDAGDDPASILPRADVLVDFSVHSATAGLAALCAEHGKPIVIGTTGHSDAERESVRSLACRIPMVWSSNYSTGVNDLFWLTKKAAEILGADYDVEIVEMHHRFKQDAPSGTARTLAEIVAEARQLKLDGAARHGREGLVGARTRAEIGIHAVRGGDVVGDHTVMFAAPGERVELVHKAASRDILARGALRAAQWVVGQPPGLYTMQDVLGLA